MKVFWWFLLQQRLVNSYRPIIRFDSGLAIHFLFDNPCFQNTYLRDILIINGKQNIKNSTFPPQVPHKLQCYKLCAKQAKKTIMDLIEGIQALLTQLLILV